ncbi:MAG: hypothetical protein ACOC0P_04645 [Planctomycetota bacterium]
MSRESDSITAFLRPMVMLMRCTTLALVWGTGRFGPSGTIVPTGTSE